MPKTLTFGCPAVQKNRAGTFCACSRHGRCTRACVRACVRVCVCMCVCVCVKGKGYKLHDYDLRQKNPYICVKRRTFCSYAKICQKCFVFFFFLKKKSS